MTGLNPAPGWASPCMDPSEPSVVPHKNATKEVCCRLAQLNSFNNSMSMVSSVQLIISELRNVGIKCTLSILFLNFLIPKFLNRLIKACRHRKLSRVSYINCGTQHHSEVENEGTYKGRQMLDGDGTLPRLSAPPKELSKAKTESFVACPMQVCRTSILCRYRC